MLKVRSEFDITGRPCIGCRDELFALAGILQAVENWKNYYRNHLEAF